MSTRTMTEAQKELVRQHYGADVNINVDAYEAGDFDYDWEALAQDAAAAKPRANRNGDACPTWCATDHDVPIIAGKPNLGYMDGHSSDYVASVFSPYRVKLCRYTDEGPKVRVDGPEKSVYLTADRARAMASELGSVPATTAALLGITDLIDHLRAAAAIVADTSEVSPL